MTKKIPIENNILEIKYKNFEFTEEFPNLFFLLLYEGGGDFQTYSKLLGYKYFENFHKHLDLYNENNKFRYLN